MPNEEHIAVVITTYNRPELLKKSAQSVINQTHSNWSLYIVNDASTEDYSTVEKNLSADPRIHFIRTAQNGGINPARNEGLNAAFKRGFNFLVFLDDDDFFAPDYFTEALQTASRKPNYGWFMSNNFGEDKPSTRHIEEESELDFIDDYIYKKFRGDKAHLFSRDILEDIQLDESFRSSHRWGFYIALSKRSKIWAFPHASVHKRYLEEGITKGTGKKKNLAFKEICYRFQKHGIVIKNRPGKLIAYRYFILECLKAIPKMAALLRTRNRKS